MAWKLVERIEPGGHRLFSHEGTPDFALADNSGNSPDSTDDGPCILDFNRPVAVSPSVVHSPHLVAGIPVLVRGKPLHAIVGSEGAVYLIRKWPHWTVRLDVGMRICDRELLLLLMERSLRSLFVNK